MTDQVEKGKKLMAQDAEAAMIGFYLLRGHSLEELLSLSHADKLFYIAAMDKHHEELEEAFKRAER